MTTRHDHTSAPTPRRTDARLNRERLVATAQEVFAEAGPKASLNEIARRAGVGPGTLYRHFPTRSALLAAVLKDRLETLCEQAKRLLASETADDALTRWLHVFLAHARANQGIGGTLMTEEPGTPGLDCHRPILEATAGLLTRAQQQGTARADLNADDLVQIVVGIALSTALSPDPEQPGRLLALVLDATYGTRRQGRPHPSPRSDHRPSGPRPTQGA